MAAVQMHPAQLKMIFGSASATRIVEPKLLKEMEFYDYAPAPCSCCEFCVTDLVRKRMYVRLYENRLEYNLPYSPCCCLALREMCVVDRVSVSYFDKSPHHAPCVKGCCPVVCCGPPVIWTKAPMCCFCISLEPVCGTTVYSAPTSCWSIKEYLCIGYPCYAYCSTPLFSGAKNLEPFLAAWRGALEAYAVRNPDAPIPMSQMAFMQMVKYIMCCPFTTTVWAA